MRRRILETIAVLAAFAVPACMPEQPQPQKATDLDSIEPKKSKKGSTTKSLPAIPKDWVAKVNGEEISTKDFRTVYDLKLKKYRRKGNEIPQSSDRRYRKSITDRLIYEKVVALEAKELGVEYDAAELTRREAKQKKGIKDWEQHLDRRGESEASLRNMLIRELREAAIMAKAGHLEVSDEDVSAEHERVKKSYVNDEPRIAAAHILCKVGPETRPAEGDAAAEPTAEQKAEWTKAAKTKCEGLSKQAKAEGADFAALAREHSDGPSAENGGELGVFTADRMVEDFSKVAFALAEGEVSKVVETEFGFHVIKVYATYPAGPLPLEALADKLRDRLAARKAVRGRHDLEKQLLAKYDVDNRMLRVLGDDKATTRGLKKKSKKATAKADNKDEPPK